MPLSTNTSPVATALRHRLNALIAATVLLYIVVISLTLVTLVQSNQIHTSLCSLRADLQHRVESTHDFLREHPKGIAGIPVATLRKSEHDQRRTIESLASLHC